MLAGIVSFIENVEEILLKNNALRFHFLSHKYFQENSTTWPLPVKIFCRDEKGERVDVSKYLIKKGLALRERRYRLLNNFLTSISDDAS